MLFQNKEDYESHSGSLHVFMHTILCWLLLFERLMAFVFNRVAVAKLLLPRN